MPHKKAKRSIREKQQAERGSDLAPSKESLKNEPIPKSAARVLNSLAIREEWKLKKRKHEDGDEGRQGKRQKMTADGTKKADKKTSLTIRPGESMQHFNKRVESDWRPLVKSAVEISRVVARNVAKTEREEQQAKRTKSKAQPVEEVQNVQKPPQSTSPLPQEAKFNGRPKEFQSASSSAPRRLNDIAQAPPELKKLPRGALSMIGKREGVLSMSQKVMMEQEREKAVARYRQLKADRRQANEAGIKTPDS
ncbi:hypothetical protein CPB84DRAFT_1684674 [Gymnopilus junonius]|uniref:Uncharacterized protein n=1 Tax=Gymnopilus junonius TaxID=109634 RepID=A0A9P5TKI5_GYMJU|nr:hypothetical protein CPB84DRAFT_1684674 [Gymnopilus junonius]